MNPTDKERVERSFAFACLAAAHKPRAVMQLQWVSLDTQPADPRCKIVSVRPAGVGYLPADLILDPLLPRR